MSAIPLSFPSRIAVQWPPALLAAASPGEDDGLPLAGRTVLLVEDEALLALDLELALRDAGADVIGPAMRLRDGLALVGEDTEIDVAVLDVDLAGEEVFPLADRLAARGIPFLFHTGHADRVELRGRFREVPLCRKPMQPAALIDQLEALLD